MGYSSLQGTLVQARPLSLQALTFDSDAQTDWGEVDFRRCTDQPSRDSALWDVSGWTLRPDKPVIFNAELA
jgi:hypothetical protein